MIYYVKLMPDKAGLFPGSTLRLWHRLATRELKTAFSPSVISLASGQTVEPKCIFHYCVDAFDRIQEYRHESTGKDNKL